jgi:hypothetical protein
MIHSQLAIALRDRGYDAESCAEAGLSGVRIPDPEQLKYATRHSRAILTFNMRDFLPLDRSWKASSREHAGIIVSRQIDDQGLLLQLTQRHLDTYAPAVQHNLLLWLDTSASR